MDKHQSSDYLQRRKDQTIQVRDVSDNLINISYPYNVDLNVALFKHQDSLLQSQYDRFQKRLPQLLIELDGVSDVSSDCRNYIQSKPHQELYDSVAFVLSKGNMSVLERHYLEQLFAYRSQRVVNKLKSNYPVGVFSKPLLARRWLESRPGSNYHH